MQSPVTPATVRDLIDRAAATRPSPRPVPAVAWPIENRALAPLN